MNFEGKPTKQYRPQAKTRAILDAGWEHVNSVPYQVSTRWLFYRLYQDKLYADKADYDKFVATFARARRHEYKEWRRDSLRDDSRVVYEHGGEYITTREWAEALRRGECVACPVDHWHRQYYYVELWYEAQAMSGQFFHYTQNTPIHLRPFKGAPSLHYKERCARDLAAAARKYDVMPVVLYFGDYDAAGMQIMETAVRDIREWCPVDFECERVGLNAGDGERFGIPYSVEAGKSSGFQWEALDDDQAGKLITSAMNKYIDHGAVDQVNAEIDVAMSRLHDHLQTFSL